MMKKILFYCVSLIFAIGFVGCKKGDNYPGGVVNSYISIFDVKGIYKSSDVTLTKTNMLGADKITGLVVSDHSGGNLPAGLLIIEDSRRLSQLRGISIPLGDDANKYKPGDSVIIKVEGGMLTKVNGTLQLKGIKPGDVSLVSSGNALNTPIVKGNDILNNPELYESTLISIAKVGFDASYPAGTKYAGDKIINDGFGNLILHTEATATFANDSIPFLSNFTGIIFNNQEDTVPQLWPRADSDITILSSTAPKIAPIIITGYLVDPVGSDADYEYVQLMATKNIDFSLTPFSLVCTNNAGASTPTGYPANGWATGDKRTYKINLSTGKVSRGQYIYVGANKNILGSTSTDISSSFWISKMYAELGGDDFGTATTNLLANSGNAAGMAIFDRTAIDESSVPVDVLFYGGNGSMFTAGPPQKGYRITNTDYYDEKNPSDLSVQPFYAMGSNTGKLAFPPANNFAQLGGRYNTSTGRWTAARTLTPLPITITSTVAEIEGATTLEQ